MATQLATSTNEAPSPTKGMSPCPRAAFVMEQHLGYETYYKNLYRSLADTTALDINWVQATYGPTDQAWERIPLLPNRIRGRLRARSRVRIGLKERPWDVAFFNPHVPARMAGNLLNGQPYIITTDITPHQLDGMSEHYDRPNKQNSLLKQYKYKLYTNSFKHAYRILPWSNWVRESLIADYGVTPDKIEVIPPGVDLELWHPGDREPNENDSANEPLRILFVGGDFYRKGGELLLSAFEQLPKGKARLDIVTRQALDKSPGVYVHNGLKPNTPELLALYQASDLFVFPTQAEAFGIAAAEAAAVGLPIIATDVGGLADIVLHGETGYLFTPQDGEQLTAYLSRLMENPTLRRQMGIAARNHAVENFDANRNAERIVSVVQEAAKA